MTGWAGGVGSATDEAMAADLAAARLAGVLAASGGSTVTTSSCISSMTKMNTSSIAERGWVVRSSTSQEI